MANKFKKIPNFLNKSPWLWRSCTESRTLSFRSPNDIFRTINSAYEEEEEEEADMSDDDDDDQIEALVKGLSLRPGKRLFLELDETNSIMTAAEAEAEAEAAVVVGGEWQQVPFKESVAMAMDSKEPYLDFKKSMEEMVEAHGLKDWKGMEMLLSWYLKANCKPNHEFIIGAFVDLLIHHHSSTNSSPSSSSSSLLCSSSSFVSSSYSCSCSSSSFFGGPNGIISSSTNSVEIIDDIVESSEYSCVSSSSTMIHVVPPLCLSSLFEDKEEENEEEDF